MTPRELLVLIDRLPRTSYYTEAVAQDDDRFADAPPEVLASLPAPEPSLTEFSPEFEGLGLLYERLCDVANVLAAKPIRFPPWPRPTSAVDRARARWRAEASEALERKLFPKR